MAGRHCSSAAISVGVASSTKRRKSTRCCRGGNASNELRNAADSSSRNAASSGASDCGTCVSPNRRSRSIRRCDRRMWSWKRLRSTFLIQGPNRRGGWTWESAVTSRVLDQVFGVLTVHKAACKAKQFAVDRCQAQLVRCDLGAHLGYVTRRHHRETVGWQRAAWRLCDTSARTRSGQSRRQWGCTASPAPIGLRRGRLRYLRCASTRPPSLRVGSTTARPVGGRSTRATSGNYRLSVVCVWVRHWGASKPPPGKSRMRAEQFTDRDRDSS